MASQCPFCNSPHRWVALLEQGGECGRSIKRTITQTIKKLIARESVLLDGYPVGTGTRTRLRSATHRFPSASERGRAYRESARKLGLCTNCKKRPIKPGYSQCATCQRERALRKRMARRIGDKKCGCGQPATNIWGGSYICPSCMKLERAVQ